MKIVKVLQFLAGIILIALAVFIFISDYVDVGLMIATAIFIFGITFLMYAFNKIKTVTSNTSNRFVF